MQAKMNNWSGWISETKPDVLIAKYRSLLSESGFTIIRECYEFFNPHGFTALFLLSESHFAIHTFPEENKSYLELSSCIDPPFEVFMSKIDANCVTL